MMFESNYDNRFAVGGDGAEAGAANGKKIILKQDSKLNKNRKAQKKRNHLGFATCFGSEKWFKGCPNGSQNGADIQNKSIQKLIGKRIPTCIALGNSF